MLMAERPWGFWTESKLDMLSAYLPAFTTASKSAPSTVYLDLFGGQATNISMDTGRPIDGSLLRAVQTTPPFTVVRGFELRQKRARSLHEAFRAEFPNRTGRAQAAKPDEGRAFPAPRLPTDCARRQRPPWPARFRARRAAGHRSVWLD